MRGASRLTHHRARASASHFHPNLIRPPPTPDQTSGGPTVGSPDTSPNGNGTVVSRRPSTHGPLVEASRLAAIKPSENTRTPLDVGGANINSLPLMSGLFEFTFLINLYLNRNSLWAVPPELLKLCRLEVLNLSRNGLDSLPRSSGRSVEGALSIRQPLIDGPTPVR